MKGCHKHHGSFTDLRPWIGAWASPYLYGGEQVGAGRSENHPKSVKRSPWNGRVEQDFWCGFTWGKKKHYSQWKPVENIQELIYLESKLTKDCNIKIDFK